MASFLHSLPPFPWPHVSIPYPFPPRRAPTISSSTRRAMRTRSTPTSARPKRTRAPSRSCTTRGKSRTRAADSERRTRIRYTRTSPPCCRREIASHPFHVASHPFHVVDLTPSTWQDSSSDLVRDLFPTDAPPSPTKTSRRPRGAKSVDKMTVGSQFMTQLASLMRTINATDVHYIRYASARLNTTYGIPLPD